MHTASLAKPITSTILLVSAFVTTAFLFYLRFVALELGNPGNFAIYTASMCPHFILMGLLWNQYRRL